jgi:hypothetical protein
VGEKIREKKTTLYIPASASSYILLFIFNLIYSQFDLVIFMYYTVLWIQIQNGALASGSGFAIRVRIQEGKND